MAPSNPFISEATKTTLAARLQETAQTPKPLTVEQLIIRNKPVLHKMLKNGHSHADMAAVLTTCGITVSGTTIEVLLNKGSKKKAVKDRTKEAQAEAALTVTTRQAEAVIAEWAHLATIRKGLTKQELVIAISTDIDAALAAGYTYEDIAVLMTEQGITIAASSLQKYHRAAKRQNPTKEKRIQPKNLAPVEPSLAKKKALKPLSESSFSETDMAKEFVL
ncbi:MAG: hypothetical protein AAF329_00010 [Cyanobacteria bacterium P01_A01_bin.17]